jgi:chromosome segregation ATPase
MSQEPDNLVLVHLRELRAEVRESVQGLRAETKSMGRKLDAVLEELRDMRAEAAADRGRLASLDTTVQTLQRRLMRTDGRLDDLAKEVAALKERVPA